MKNKKDIGALLKRKLHGVQKTPSISLWDRVDATLNKKDKKRKRILWIWLGSGAFLIISLLYGVSIGDTSNNRLEKQKDKNAIENKSQKVTSEELQKPNETSTIVSKPTDENPINKALKIEVISEELDLKNNNIDKTIVSKKKTVEKNISDEGYTVKTTYYYYNGANNEQITTTNKKSIDSLLNAENLKDTLNTEQNLSIKNLRNADSLNR